LPGCPGKVIRASCPTLSSLLFYYIPACCAKPRKIQGDGWNIAWDVDEHLQQVSGAVLPPLYSYRPRRADKRQFARLAGMWYDKILVGALLCSEQVSS